MGTGPKLPGESGKLCLGLANPGWSSFTMWVGGERRDRLPQAGISLAHPFWSSAVTYLPIQETLFTHLAINIAQKPNKGGCISI